MHNVKSVKSVELFPAIIELLMNDHKVKISVTGNSMMPFLRENTDCVELSLASFNELRFGQIVLIKRDSGAYILHRLVYNGRKGFYIAGDAQCYVEGPLLPHQLIAVVTRVWRRDRLVSPSGILWRTASFLWWLRLPVRYAFIKPYRLIKKLFSKIFGKR